MEGTSHCKLEEQAPCQAAEPRKTCMSVRDESRGLRGWGNGGGGVPRKGRQCSGRAELGSVVVRAYSLARAAIFE
jgi:hypothetical protein